MHIIVLHKMFHWNILEDNCRIKINRRKSVVFSPIAKPPTS
nr:MAG TPA: hypothetical protein [Caudoviricetes sp.]